jgi:replicative DNA helicase
MKKSAEPPSLTQNPFPNDENLEAVVLGALLIERQAMPRVAHLLKPEIFFKPEHGKIYRAIADLYEKGEPVDIVTVAGRLQKLGMLEEIGGPHLIAGLSARVASSAHLEYHTLILLQLYLRRELIRTNKTHTRGSMDMTIDLADQINAQRAALDTIESHVGGHTLRTLGEVADAAMEEARRRMENSRDGLTGIPTGLNELDSMTAGLQRGDLTILAGRPAMGKTAVSLRMAWRAAQAGYKVFYCSIEMNAERLMDRWIVGEAGIDPDRWKKGQATPEEMEKALGMMEEIRKLPIHVDDNPIMTMDYIFSKARVLQQKGLCDIVFVDYLQLSQLKSENRNDTRTVTIGDATRKAKLMAKKLDAPVVLLSQLNRKPEERPDKRPELSDLRDSGQIEQDADLVVMVHRPEVAGEKKDGEGKGPAKQQGILIVAKNRHGATGDIYFGHNESMTQIKDCVSSAERKKKGKGGKIDAKKLREKYKN